MAYRPAALLLPAEIAVRLVAPDLEEAFLRRIRERLFLDALNIAWPDVLLEAAAAVGVDQGAYQRALADGSAEAAFAEDMRRVRALGAAGFPTLFIEGVGGKMVVHGVHRTAA